ncbi:hypothetical protein DY245_43180 [Streptomyces inhibens]|uniref:Uncharacterized protein n=1 Tax=Streptomyces inhibens TaxID=2293571 RepID=A0A371PQ74_STRIH|nr:hypothetical protein [Streptomyces inhibens]REK84459.1 hypothetical protein DY245_43180 [Streptomyces inhibens]
MIVEVCHELHRLVVEIGGVPGVEDYMVGAALSPLVRRAAAYGLVLLWPGTGKHRRPRIRRRR